MKTTIIQEPIRGHPSFRELFLLHYFTRYPELKGADLERDATGYALCDISMQINGIEIDPLQFLDRMVEGWDDAVKKAAAEMVEEKLSDMVGQLEDIAGVARRATYQLLGVEMTEDW